MLYCSWVFCWTEILLTYRNSVDMRICHLQANEPYKVHYFYRAPLLMFAYWIGEHQQGSMISDLYESRHPSSVRIGTQGLFCPYLKTFVTSFFLTRLTAPGSPSGFLCALVLIWPFYRRVRYSVGRSMLSCYHGVHGQRWRAFSDTILFLAKSIGTLI